MHIARPGAIDPVFGPDFSYHRSALTCAGSVAQPSARVFRHQRGSRRMLLRPPQKFSYGDPAIVPRCLEKGIQRIVRPSDRRISWCPTVRPRNITTPNDVPWLCSTAGSRRSPRLAGMNLRCFCHSPGSLTRALEVLTGTMSMSQSPCLPRSGIGGSIGMMLVRCHAQRPSA